MLDADAAPMSKGFARGCNGGFSFRNACFGHGADDLFRRAGIEGVNEAGGPNLLAVDNNGIFLTQAATHFAERGPHFFLVAAVHEVYQRRVFVGVPGRRTERGAVAGVGAARRRFDGRATSTTLSAGSAGPS